MKKIINNVLSVVLTMTMIISMFAGTGVVAKAAVDDTLLDVYVRDTEGKAVDGLQLILENKDNSSQVFKFADLTESNNWVSGNASLDIFDDEVPEGTYYLKITNSSDYNCPDTVEVVVVKNTTGYGSLYIDKVNGNEYSQDDGFILTVESVTADAVTEETKTALDTAIKEASEAKEEDYTAESWKAYKDAIDAANALVAKEGATETEYQDAIKAINEAKGKLVKAEAPQEPSVTQDVKVTKVALSGISKKIAAGKKVQLTANVAPANAANKAVTWTTSNKKYATVTANGKVTVKKAGAGKTVTITATAKDGSGVKATYKIKIMKNAVKSIKLKAAKTVKAGKKVAVKATVKTTGKKANKTLKWTSSNTKYATVTSKGKVTTKKAGKGKKVKITAKATDGSNKKKTVTIKIK